MGASLARLDPEGLGYTGARLELPQLTDLGLGRVDRNPPSQQSTGVKGTGNSMHYLLFYEVGEDYVSRRAEHRDAHLEKAWRASERGELVLGGALAGPVDGAVLLFSGNSPEIAERFARADPYVTNGLVKRWHVREWTTVVGQDAAMPVKGKTTRGKQ